VLDPEAPEDLGGAIVHPDRNGKAVFPLSLPEQGPSSRVQLHARGHAIELGLSHLEGVVTSVCLRHGLFIPMMIVVGYRYPTHPQT
jgi:hypothetical protein